MKFARFSKYGFLSNWGSYTPQERDVLNSELRVTSLLQDNDWVARVPLAKPLVASFLSIQTNNKVTDAEIPELQRRLAKIATSLSAMTEGSPQFVNHQPDALVGEIRSHLLMRTDARKRGNQKIGRIISYKADLRNHEAANFHEMIASGQKLLWTLDIDGFLSIGDPQGNKHSVVAAGKDVKGAGIAQRPLDNNTDSYLAMLDQKTRAAEFERRAEDPTTSKSDRETLLENAEHMRGQAADYAKALRGWTPPHPGAAKFIELDFDSGHYTPREAWKASAAAWKEAGYEAQWSESGKFV